MPAVLLLDQMDAITELIRRYSLEEDLEHIIIPLPGPGGTVRRCFLLKRPYIRVVYPDGSQLDFPIAEAIEAIIRFPDLGLRESLSLLHQELDSEIERIFEDKKGVT
ncbi:MAG: hypothetical protein M0Z79_07960 [Nitrospiraceae bacterium]|nr:hypothetical protein [Nitrospiraceae bacterium]